MADIKTRDAVKGTIKTIDKAAVAGQRMKQAYISTKDKAEHSTSAAENSADEYEARFKFPERFFKQGNEIKAVPYKPKTRGQER